MDKARKIIIFSLNQTGCIEYTVEMLHAFRAYKPKVIVNQNAASRYDYYDDTIRTYTSKLNFIPQTFLFWFKCFKMLKRLKTDFQDIVIYLPAFHYWNYIILKKAKKLNIPCFLTVHDFHTHLGEKNLLIESVQRKTIALGHKVIFLSHSESLKAIASGVDANKIIHLPHPLFRVKTINNLPFNNKPRLLFFGRIKKYKGLDMLLEACQNLNFNKLTIAGKGDDLNYSQENVQFIKTTISDQHLNKLLNSHEFLILPYLEATQSGVLSLGLSKEIPMIICNHPGLKEQISDNSCYWSGSNTKALEETLRGAINDEAKYDSVKQNLKDEKSRFASLWTKKFSSLIDQISHSKL